MAEEKIRLGKGTRQPNRPNWIKATITEANLRVMLDNLDDYNGHKYVKININIYPDAKPDKYDKIKDVEITLDTWKPNGQHKPRTAEPIDAEYTERQNRNANDESVSDSELPF